MSITLATTWHPRGETLRLRRLYPLLAELYNQVVVIVPPSTHAGMVLSFRVYQKLAVMVADEWSMGRHLALQHALTFPHAAIHYADMDRLLRWAETRPAELHQTVERIQQAECLVIGRSPRAMDTHPRALAQTEAIPNQIFSHILGQPLDLSAGSKGFRRDVAQFIVQNSQGGKALGTDSEWVILARRGGYKISGFLVDGLDWESADRHAEFAADDEKQRLAAAEYDADPQNWQHRVQVADEIVAVGIETLKRTLKPRADT